MYVRNTTVTKEFTQTDGLTIKEMYCQFIDIWHKPYTGWWSIKFVKHCTWTCNSGDGDVTAFHCFSAFQDTVIHF